MPANTSPVFTLVPNVGTVPVTAANTSSQGGGTIGTDIFKAFTAGTNGSFVWRIRFNPTASTPTTTNATVGRAFLSSQTSGATTGGTNTWFLGEVALPATPADNASAPSSPIELMINFAIPAGYTILITNHAAPAANTNWQTMVIGGDY